MAVRDGAGGWYLGGDFTRIGGQPAGGLAHVLASGELDTDFLPVTNGLVSAMVLVQDTLYVGGSFSSVDGTARGRLAALSTEDGSLLPFDAPQASRVTEMVFSPPADGPGRLYVASDGIHALDATSGAPVPGFSAPPDSPVQALALGADRLYVGGAEVIALDPDTGAVDAGFDTGTPMAVDANHRVHTLLPTADRLYIGSDRTLVQGQAGRLVAVDPETGHLDPTFAPVIPSKGNLPYVAAGVYDLALNGDELWAGGSFEGGLAVVDAATGAAADIDVPSYDLQVNAVEQSAGSMYVGGHFYMSDVVKTRGVAAFDAETLDPVPSFRSTENAYGDLFVGAGAVWIAGTNHMGYDPSALAAESSTYFYDWTRDVVALDPETGARIAARSMKVKNLTGITTIGNRLYVARRLENDQRFPLNRVDVYGPSGKKVDSFQVQRRGYITELSSLGGDLVAAGSFEGRYLRSAIVKIDPATGKVRHRFDPKINGPVYDVARSGNGMVAAGLFKEVWGGYDATWKRPGLERMRPDGVTDTGFLPKAFDGNRVLLHVEAIGDLLWVDGASRAFLDAKTGKPVADPTGGDAPWWVAGVSSDDLAYTSLIFPNLGGRTGFKLAYVAAGR
ncbi:PQQ-binding-like beta-propeller repeat protein [Nocardioides sp. SR21]|uniref:outer membrane protein assembly factor BamB family protein n=1 Tax=Nocardioides sp. SR21 TaxID=2919501 RepID=UPI001FAAC560|nr:PQQ-binding-like beta-propeller repeat protein [Nocardioides sp. SR21]